MEVTLEKREQTCDLVFGESWGKTVKLLYKVTLCELSEGNGYGRILLWSDRITRWKASLHLKKRGRWRKWIHIRF